LTALGPEGSASLIRRLADHALVRHPDRALGVLERLEAAETVELLERTGLDEAAAIIERLSPRRATVVLQGLSPARAAALIGRLPADTAARLLRRLDEEPRSIVLDGIEPAHARSILAVLRFPEGTVGALMDPNVLALPQEISAGEALERVREAAEHARYNVYVVAAGQRLVGALNLRELLLASEAAPLSGLMVRDPHRLRADADWTTLLGHPGWRAVHALPVVDGAGAYLGAVRYRTLRRLEDDVAATRHDDVDTSSALGDLLAAGARGLLDAFAAGARPGGSK
jgi:magnesium transporter